MKSFFARALVAFAIGLPIVVTASRAHAANEAAAEALFLEAKKLMDQGRFSDACPKFAESNRLDRGAGTLIHLGDCYEKNKQLASAWATYREATSAAQALGRAEWEKLAKERAAALEPKLAKLVVKVPKDTPKMSVTRDGVEVARASWNVEIPVDAGKHAFEATAPGHQTWKTNIAVAKDGDKVEVVVPELASDPTGGAGSGGGGSASTSSGSSSQATIGWVVGGVGVVALGVGAVTGLMAISKNNDAKGVCPNDGPCRDRDAVDAADSAKSLGMVSTIGFVAGGVLLAGGVALVLTAPKSRERASIRLAPYAGADGGGAFAMGSF